MVFRGDFPAPIKLGARAVGWVETEVAQWLEGRKVHRLRTLVNYETAANLALRPSRGLFPPPLQDWEGRCSLSGIADRALLRASHIVPWADCDSDAVRLDVHNGLLLSALWDAAFDRGLVTFDDEGVPQSRLLW